MSDTNIAGRTAFRKDVLVRWILRLTANVNPTSRNPIAERLRGLIQDFGSTDQFNEFGIRLEFRKLLGELLHRFHMVHAC